jgi:hypothetical protein
MLKSKHPDPDPDRDKPPARTGHGTASVIARLNEQALRVEPGEIEEPADSLDRGDGSPASSSAVSSATPLRS